MTLPLSEKEFEQQLAAATRRGAERRRSQPLATSVRYDAVRGLMIGLNNDCSICVPLRLLPELHGAALKDLRRVEIAGVGQAIHWPTLDQQFDVLQLIADVLKAKGFVTPRGPREVKSKAAPIRAVGAKRARPRKPRKVTA